VSEQLDPQELGGLRVVLDKQEREIERLNRLVVAFEHYVLEGNLDRMELIRRIKRSLIDQEPDQDSTHRIL
jgi:hypothetical protein